MTTIQADPQTIDGTVTGGRSARTTAPAMWRLTVVELRKLADTRAGLWMLIVIGVAAAGTVVLLLTAGDPPEQTFAQFFSFGLLPASVLLPVLGILSMTGEWSQRTALTTFALVPQRGRVLTAKLTAAVLIAVLSTAVTGLLAVAGNLVAIALDGDGSWKIEAAMIGRFLVLEVLLVVMGSAFGALLLNSPLAIVLYFAVPTLWTVLGELVKWLHTAAEWLDINVTMEPLTAVDMTSGQWARLGTSAALWVALPLILGTVRMLRREVS
jgi:hypothetical protein